MWAKVKRESNAAFAPVKVECEFKARSEFTVWLEFKALASGMVTRDGWLVTKL